MTKSQWTAEEILALKIAHDLVDAGIPVFAAEQCPPDCPLPQHHGGPGQYHLPRFWQQTAPSHAQVDRWQPGWALGAVGGWAGDWLDIDPRSGGLESEKELRHPAIAQFPRSFGQQGTPSGGFHHLISATGERKSTGFMPGLDLQSGGPLDHNGTTGRGFVYIAPTVRLSKAAETLGELRAYRWLVEPDLEALAEFRGSDDSIEGIVARVRAKRSPASTAPASSAAPPADAFGPFATVSTVTASAPRMFGMSEAQDFVRPFLISTQQAPIGQIEERCNAAAAVLSHFVPSHWSVDEGMNLLSAALTHTAYDPAGPGTWTVDKFRAVLDGTRPTVDPWRATLRTEVYVASEREHVPGRLRRAMLRRSEIHALPDPVPLIEDVLYRNSVTVLAGKFGTYKSFIAVSWACALATGTSWFGHAVPQRVVVIYAAAEGAYGIRKRLDAWEARNGPIPDDLYLIPLSVRLNRPEDMRELEEIIIETGAAVLIFDTLHASTPGMDENDAGEAGAVLDVLRGLQERHGICSILPHHTGHAGERARGSSSLEDDADVSFVVRIEGEDRGPETRRTLVHRKTKDAALIEPVDLMLELVEGTGSGYVRPANPFEVADGDVVPDADPGQERTVREPEDWTNKITQPDAYLQRQILQVLADVASDVGRTEEKVRGIVAERWYGGQTGRKRGMLNKQAFEKAWLAAQGLTFGQGGDPESVVVPGSAGPKSFIINPSALSELG